MTTATAATATTTTFLTSNPSLSTSTPAIAVAATTVTNSNYYKHVSSAGASTATDHLHNQSTYKKLTELFVHKKNIQPNMPDLGLGNSGKSNSSVGKDYQQTKNTIKANNSDVRRQFLASLAPLSCVTVNSTDTQEDYYGHNSRMVVTENCSSSTYDAATAAESIYDLSDVQTSLHQDDGNYNIGQPDVTKGTPTFFDRPDIGDNTTDELLAFVEQDRFRTERIKRRYNDDQYQLSINGTSNYVSGNKLVEKSIDSKNEVIDNGHRQRVGPIYRESIARDNNGNKNTGELQRLCVGRYSNGIATVSNDGNDEHNDDDGGEENDEGDNNEDNDKRNDNDDKDGDDDNDELNDYGFNRRPSVTGIKQQRTTNGSGESFHRSTLSNAGNTNVSRTNFHPSVPTYYENNCIRIDGRIALYDGTIDDSTPNSFVGTLLANERDASTINRINTMQKQIDDIYQTIVENTNVTAQNSLERETYTDEAFARQAHLRLPINDPAFRIYQEQRNGQQYCQEQLNTANARTSLRGIAVGAEEIDTIAGIADNRDYANTLSAKPRRREPLATTAPSNYHCNAMPTVYTGLPANTKCYRTMYFVPYNGLSDPTYQNIQRILPSHPSPSYTNHIERYPYPRSNKSDQLQAQTQTQTQMQSPSTPSTPSTSQLRYYHVGNRSLSPISNMTQTNLASPIPSGSLGHSMSSESFSSFDPRPTPISTANPPVTLQPTQQTFHLHLHHHQQQPEDLRIAFHHHQHQHQHQHQYQHQHQQQYQHQLQHQHQYQQQLQLQHQHHQHHRHHHQPMFYRLPSTVPAVSTQPPSSSPSPSSSYAVIAPTKCATFAGNGAAPTESSYRFYQVHLGRTVLAPPTDALQSTQTFLSSSTASCSPPLPSSASYSSSLSTSFSSLPTITVTVAPQQTLSTFVLPNHVSEPAVHATNFDTAFRTGAGIVQSNSNNIVVSTIATITATTTTTTTTSASSSSSSSSSTSSSSSSASSSLSYSFSSSSSSASSCSSSSSLQIPCSPSKLQQQQQQQLMGPYTGMERGVPEGAASVSGHDIPQSGILLASNTYGGHNPNGVTLPTHAQNSVYYAMNV